MLCFAVIDYLVFIALEKQSPTADKQKLYLATYASHFLRAGIYVEQKNFALAVADFIQAIDVARLHGNQVDATNASLGLVTLFDKEKKILDELKKIEPVETQLDLLKKCLSYPLDPKIIKEMKKQIQSLEKTPEDEAKANKSHARLFKSKVDKDTEPGTELADLHLHLPRRKSSDS